MSCSPTAQSLLTQQLLVIIISIICYVVEARSSRHLWHVFIYRDDDGWRFMTIL